MAALIGAFNHYCPGGRCATLLLKKYAYLAYKALAMAAWELQAPAAVLKAQLSKETHTTKYPFHLTTSRSHLLIQVPAIGDTNLF